MSGEEDADMAVEVITMHGHFVDRTAAPPPGRPTPRGLWLTVILDAASGEPMETVIADHPPPLGVLGRVRRIEWSADGKREGRVVHREARTSR
jgi:hypothetical protein